MLSHRYWRIAVNAVDMNIPDNELTQQELVLRLIITKSNKRSIRGGAIPADFLRFPGLYEFSARIAELRNMGFTIASKPVDGKRYNVYSLPEFEIDVIRAARNDKKRKEPKPETGLDQKGLFD